MGADRCLWMFMSAYGCTDVQKLSNYAIWAQGDVGMHDLGVPGGREISRNIMSRLILLKKTKNEQTTHRTSFKARNRHAINLSRAKTKQQPQKTHATGKTRHAQKCGKTQYQQIGIGK